MICYKCKLSMKYCKCSNVKYDNKTNEARTIDKSITEEDAEYILWNETAFPFSDLEHSKKQFKKAVQKMMLNKADVTED